jgi:hypothetical protein
MTPAPKTTHTRYGVYYIPPLDCPFYTAGSAVLGYDIRRHEVTSSTPIITDAHFFGLHASIRGIFVTQHLSALRHRLSALTKTAAPILQSQSFIHSFQGTDRAILFRSDDAHRANLYDLHVRVVDVVDAFRIKSYVSPETTNILPSLTTEERRLLRDHGDVRVLERFLFRFTLARYGSPDELYLLDNVIEERAGDLLGVDLNLKSLSLVEQTDDESYWRIVEEFPFGGA